MPVKVIVRLIQDKYSGVNMTFQAHSDGDMSEDEIEMANTIVAICNLLSDNQFQASIKPWVQKELIELHSVEDGTKDISKVVM